MKTLSASIGNGYAGLETWRSWPGFSSAVRVTALVRALSARRTF